MRKENQINLSILKMQSLTDTNGRQHPDSRIWWVALWEERLDRVDGEGEGHDGDCRRSHLEMMMIVMMVVVVVMVVMNDGEGERHDGDRRRPHHNALHPKTHEGQKPPKGDHDVRVVSSWTKKLSLRIE